MDDILIAGKRNEVTAVGRSSAMVMDNIALVNASVVTERAAEDRTVIHFVELDGERVAGRWPKVSQSEADIHGTRSPTRWWLGVMQNPTAADGARASGLKGLVGWVEDGGLAGRWSAEVAMNKAVEILNGSIAYRETTAAAHEFQYISRKLVCTLHCVTLGIHTSTWKARI